MEMSRLTRDGTAEPISRDQILRHARGQGNIIFPVQLTTSRIGNLTRLIHTLLYVMTIHTYIHTLLTGFLPPEFRGGVHLFIYNRHTYTIGSVPSLSGHAVIAYRWRSLPRVRRHRASKPHGSSARVLPWQVTMDQLIRASISHTYYWYEVAFPSSTKKQTDLHS